MSAPADYRGWECGTYLEEERPRLNPLTGVVRGVWVRYRILAQDPERWVRVAAE